jgi:pimeloyl-ACP methyl ester carboxylesterase
VALELASFAGAAALLGAAAATAYGTAVAGVVREAMRPERKTVGWALGRGLPTEPGHWGTPSHEWNLEFRGSRCPVFELGERDAAAPTALILHGFARSRYDSLARAGAFVGIAPRILLPDLPGHGDAQGRGTRLGTDEEDFAAAVLDAAGATGPVYLAGHSLGATIAVRAASLPALAPRVKGVLALAPYESLRTPLAARMELRAMPTGLLLAPTLRLLALRGIRERSTTEAAARLACRFAVVAGSWDPVTPLAEADRIARAAPNGRLWSVPGARHDDFHTLGRLAVDEAVRWLAES